VTETVPVAPGVRPPLRGEFLRDGHEPTVAALMARRVESMMKATRGQDLGLHNALSMAGMLAAWDPTAGKAMYREMMRIGRGRDARAGRGGPPDRVLAVTIARLTMARIKNGDDGAIPEYAEWVRTTSPDGLEGTDLEVLEPIRFRPDDPALADAASWLFGDPQSPWVPLIGRKGSKSPYQSAPLIASAMVEVPAFRKMVLAALEDRTPLGTAEVTDNGAVSVQLGDNFSMGRTAPRNDPDAPARGTRAEVRTCDFYAWQLATFRDAPPFNPCWPEARRDAALVAMADYLRNEGTPDRPPVPKPH
jgi:hypothetical protein